MSLFCLNCSVSDISDDMIRFVNETKKTLTGDELKRVNRYVSPIHQFQQIASFAMQQFAVSQYFLIHNLPLICGPPKIIRPPNEKPYCQNYNNVHFNTSHSGGCIVVYVDTRPCGVDIEYRDVSNDSRHSDILYDLFGVKHGITRKAFYPATSGIRLWTRIEAWLKLSGLGFKSLSDISVSHNPIINEFTLSHNKMTMPRYKDITTDLPDNVYGTLVLENGVRPAYVVENVSLDDLLDNAHISM